MKKTLLIAILIQLISLPIFSKGVETSCTQNLLILFNKSHPVLIKEEQELLSFADNLSARLQVKVSEFLKYYLAPNSSSLSKPQINLEQLTHQITEYTRINYLISFITSYPQYFGDSLSFTNDINFLLDSLQSELESLEKSFDPNLLPDNFKLQDFTFLAHSEKSSTLDLVETWSSLPPFPLDLMDLIGKTSFAKYTTLLKQYSVTQAFEAIELSKNNAHLLLQDYAKITVSIMLRGGRTVDSQGNIIFKDPKKFGVTGSYDNPEFYFKSSNTMLDAQQVQKLAFTYIYYSYVKQFIALYKQLSSSKASDTLRMYDPMMNTVSTILDETSNALSSLVFFDHLSSTFKTPKLPDYYVSKLRETMIIKKDNSNYDLPLAVSAFFDVDTSTRLLQQFSTDITNIARSVSKKLAMQEDLTTTTDM